MKIFYVLIGLLILNKYPLKAQSDTIISERKLHFFEREAQYNKKRFSYAATLGGTAYVAFSYGFYNSWYKNYPQSEFHLFNDIGEWNQIDKTGHIFSGYFQSLFCYNGAKWAGLSEKKSITTGLLAGTLFQTTIEVMDGFSKEWGFSLGDIAANTIGLSSFYLQQKRWQEQRITLKESAWPRTYSDMKISSKDGSATTTIRQRALDLYGSSWGERMLKDYNTQTYWASVNVKSFFPDSRWPDWLNIALGYGADNMYGGYENIWTDKNGKTFDLSSFRRQRQFFLALDYDLRKLPIKSRSLMALMHILNIYKFPAPAIEYNSEQGFKIHLLFK
jgi:hypothetical protein